VCDCNDFTLSVGLSVCLSVCLYARRTAAFDELAFVTFGILSPLSFKHFGMIYQHELSLHVKVYIL